jgi:hypothetical protein
MNTMSTMNNRVGHIQRETEMRHLAHSFLPPAAGLGAMAAVIIALEKGYIEGGFGLQFFTNAAFFAAAGYGAGTLFTLWRETKASDGKSFVNVRTG